MRGSFAVTGRAAASSRPPRLDDAPLDYAPENEQGVVFLFAHLARRRYGLRVERVQQGFPDFIAYWAGRRVRIEFEYRSSSFAADGRDPSKCDWSCAGFMIGPVTRSGSASLSSARSTASASMSGFDP